VFANENTFVGTYEVRADLYSRGFYEASMVLQIKVIPRQIYVVKKKKAAFSIGAECTIPSVKVAAYDSLNLTLPQCLLITAEDSKGYLNVDISAVSSFTEYSGQRLSFSPLPKHIGNYFAKVTIENSTTFKPIYPPYKFKITVIRAPPVPPFECPLGKVEKCMPSIVSINKTGIITLKFPQGLNPVNESAYAQLK
jgi:hypothetical protein